MTTDNEVTVLPSRVRAAVQRCRAALQRGEEPSDRDMRLVVKFMVEQEDRHAARDE